MNKVLLGNKNGEDVFSHIRDWDNRSMANISFQMFLYFATLIYTATFKPEFHLPKCQYFNLFFAHTDARNIIRIEIDISSLFAMLLWIFTARAIKPRFGATSGFFWNRCICWTLHVLLKLHPLLPPPITFVNNLCCVCPFQLPLYKTNRMIVFISWFYFALLIF